MKWRINTWLHNGMDDFLPSAFFLVKWSLQNKKLCLLPTEIRLSIPFKWKPPMRELKVRLLCFNNMELLFCLCRQKNVPRRSGDRTPIPSRGGAQDKHGIKQGFRQGNQDKHSMETRFRRGNRDKRYTKSGFPRNPAAPSAPRGKAVVLTSRSR